MSLTVAILLNLLRSLAKHRACCGLLSWESEQGIQRHGELKKEGLKHVKGNR